MLRQAAEKTGDMVGGGTSTSTILAHAIFADGVRNVVAGASAIDVKRGLDRATKRAVEALRALSRPVKSRKEKAQAGDRLVGESAGAAADGGVPSAIDAEGGVHQGNWWPRQLLFRNGPAPRSIRRQWHRIRG